jgi:glycosyltransferase involved in cell wall biosynthesis
VLLIDDGLKDWSGHNAAYALSVVEELCRRGTGCELFANCRMSKLPIDGFPVHLTFQNFAAGMFFESRVLPRALNRLARVASANWSHLRDLFSKVTPYVRKGDLLLVLIASSRTTVAYALWLRWLAMTRRSIAVVFIVHNRPEALFKWEARFLETVGAGHRLYWASHTEPVQKMCAEAVGSRSFLLPLPFGATGTVKSLRSPSGSGVIFSYLGVAGLPKGLDILVDAIDSVTDLLRDGRLKLIVQCNIHLANNRLEELKKRLKALARDIPGIEVIEKALTDAEYRERMSDTDVVLIPHRRQFYQYALSGIFTEALAMGKPVVATSDTYMAKELLRSGAGVCFEDGDPLALAQAMRSVVDNIEALSNRASAAQNAWRAIHNADRYVTDLCAVAEREC